MTPDSVTIIGKAVSADAKGRQPSRVERALAASMLESAESEAGQLLTAGCEPGEEVEPLTPERVVEMVDRLGLPSRPANPFPPSHPLHGAWEIAERHRRDWMMAFPSC